MRSNKARFFIHNGPGVSTDSAEDVKEFLIKHVAASKDVLIDNLMHNYDQLPNNP